MGDEQRGGPDDESTGLRLHRLLADLKRRHVFRVAAFYGVVGYTIIEVSDTVLPRIPLPDWTVSAVVWIVLLLLAFNLDGIPGLRKIERAASFADRLPERDARLIGLGNFRVASEADLVRFTQLYPDDADGWMWLGESRFHGQGYDFNSMDGYRAYGSALVELSRLGGRPDAALRVRGCALDDSRRPAARAAGDPPALPCRPPAARSRSAG